MKEMKRILSLVLCFVMLVGMMPAITLNADATGTATHYLAFATDRHGDESVIASVLANMESNGGKPIEYVGLGGDMVDSGTYYTSNILADEINAGLETDLTYEQVDFIDGSHDEGATDTTGAEMFHKVSEKLYEGEDYYVYGVVQSDMESASAASTAASAFVTWANGSDIDTSKVIIVLSHLPLHQKRDDNFGATHWHSALNSVADSNSDGTIDRDVIFFHGHNHTKETANYFYEVGDTITLQGTSSGSSQSGTTCYTYATAGYLKANQQATLVTITETTYSLTRYGTSGEGTDLVTVTRASGSTEDGSGSGSGTTTEEKEVYVLVDELTVGKDYLIANGNSGTVTLLGQSSGSAQTTTAEVKTSGDYTYIETADTGYIWNATAHPNSSYSTYPRLINAETYAMYLSSSAVSFSSSLTSTSGAQYTRYWTYTDGVMACPSTNSNSSTYYLTYSDSAFDSSSSSATGIYIYEKQTITVSSDGTVSGGGSTEGGDSGSTGDGEDDTTGGSTETVVGDGTYTTADDGSYQKVTFGSSTTETKTVYVLTDTLTSGKNYLIVDANAVGSGNAITNSSNSVGNTTVTISNGSLTIDGTTSTETYIVLGESDTGAVWTAGTNSSSSTFKNDSYYIYHDSGELSLSTSTSKNNWTWSSNTLYYTGGNTTRYLTYDSGWTLTTDTANVYLYQEQTATVTTGSSVTYSVTAEDIEHFYTADTTDTETVTITASVTEGTPSGSYSYEVVADEKGIISGDIASDGTITFTGNEGNAQVKVSYTWAADTDVNEDGTVDANDTYTIWQVIDVTATGPYYTIELHEAVITYTAVTGAFDSTATYFIQKSDGTYEKVEITAFEEGVTYYTVSATPSADPIENTIALKGKQAGDTYSVWAVIKYYDGIIADGETEDGTDLEDVPDSRILWKSSNTNIATIDPSTGLITFTGNEYGKFTITAYYLDENGDVLCEDKIEISVTQTQYVVPEDDVEDDFPEYPREGAIRYDKTATAVGNFSETGIAQVELSMTGVPYTTGSEYDVLLIVDASGSMDESRIEAAQDATFDFVSSIVTNTDGSFNKNRVGIMYFGAKEGYPSTTISGIDETGDGFAMSTVSSIASDSDVYKAIYDNFPTSSGNSGSGGPNNSGSSGTTTIQGGYSGGTNYDNAFEVAYNIISSVKQTGRPVYVVFITDGGPTQYTPLSSVTEDSNGGYTLTAGTTLYMTQDSTTVWSTYVTNGTAYQDNYYAAKIKYGQGATMYTVSIELDAEPDGQYEGKDEADMMAMGAGLLSKIASTSDKYYAKYADTTNGTTDLTKILAGIAQQIKQAATDVVVADKITPQYTMVFDAPNDVVNDKDGSQEYYIEVNEWTLSAVDDDNDGVVDDYIRDTATSKLKLYLDWSSGSVKALDGNNDKAEFAAPTFNTTAIGTMFYWTTGATSSGVSVTVDGTTYNFDPVGISNTDEDFDSSVWFNMASGAYASGTLTTDTVVVNNTDGTTTETESTTCKDLIIATPLFVYNATTKMLYWTAEKLSTTELTLSYFVYLDQSGGWVGAEGETDPGTYPTNVGATITYTNYQDHRCQQEFPIPQMTWKGAQVTYVFYLVNEYGQPVSRSGLRIPFSEAVYVTKEYTHSVVWNEEGGVTALNAAELAEGLVPEVYTLYDPEAYYEINVYMTTGEETGYDHFIIEGGTADEIATSINSELGKNLTSDDVSTSTTKVFNTKADYEHRYSTYGAYSNVSGTYKSTETDAEYAATVVTDFDYCNTTVAFAVVWSPALVPDTVVVDYGLDVVIDVATNDSMAAGVVGVRNDIPTVSGTEVKINSGNYTAAEAKSAQVKIGDLVVGTATVENLTSVRFSLDKTNGMLFNEPAVFYYESEVNYYTYDSDDNKTLTTTDMYSSVTVIPATTIYYEDEYVTLTTHTKNDDGSYTETKGWPTSSTAATATQAQDRPGVELIVSSPDANNVYGYDAAYSAMSTHSMNNSAMITVSAGVEGQANFDFYGTGFDVISLTSNKTGTIIVEVTPYNADGTLNTDGSKSYVVDTYYGYTRTDNGDGTYSWEITDPNADNALYQVPVMKFSGLTYGKYHAKIVVFYDEFFDNVGDGSYDFYLDAIRIYDPTGNKNTIANNAYGKDGEGWPTYKEVRDYVIEQSTESSLGDDAVEGIVFIDGVGNTSAVADYTSYGPNNELYLAPGQAIAFELNATPTAGEVAKVQMALKTVGGTASVKIYAVDGTTALDSSITTATDMYYDITALNNKTVVIMNTGDTGVLSITNVKVTYTAEQTEASPAMFMLRRSSVDAALATMNVEEEVPETTVPETEATEPETTVPETEATEPETTVPETEATEPETTVPETTVPETEATEPETEATEPETTVPEESEPNTEEQVQEVIEKVTEVIKWIFGWLFG